MQRFLIFLDQLLNPYYQNEIPSSTIVCCMTKISNMFLAQYWRLETGSGPFMIYNITKCGHFHFSHLPFLNGPYSSFQKNETLES